MLAMTVCQSTFVLFDTPPREQSSVDRLLLQVTIANSK